MASRRIPLVPSASQMTQQQMKTAQNHGQAPAPKHPTDKTAHMFRDYVDLNGVEISCNSHSEIEYEHHERSMARFGDRRRPLAPMVESEVYSRVGMARVGGMSFQSLLTPANPGTPGERQREDG